MAVPAKLSDKSLGQLERYIKKLIKELHMRLDNPEQVALSKYSKLRELTDTLQTAMAEYSSRLTSSKATSENKTKKPEKKIFLQGFNSHLIGVEEIFFKVMKSPASKVKLEVERVFSGLLDFLTHMRLEELKEEDEHYRKVLYDDTAKKTETSRKLLAACEQSLKQRAEQDARNDWHRRANSIATQARDIHAKSEFKPKLFYIGLDKKLLQATVIVLDSPTPQEIVSALLFDPKAMRRWVNLLHGLYVYKSHEGYKFSRAC